MTKFVRIMLGKGSVHAQECFDGGFIGVDFNLTVDLTNRFPENWEKFNKEFVPILMEINPGKTKVGAGLACGMTWTVAKGLSVGDYVISPTGDGRYRFGQISGDYQYLPGEILFHRRPVKWLNAYFGSEDVSPSLKRSMGSIGTTSDVSTYESELFALLQGKRVVEFLDDGTIVEESAVFALEKYLEEFLVSNWSKTEIGKTHDIYQDENGTGNQYSTAAGIIDILAQSKDGSELLIIELKKGRTTDTVAGQIARYMGYAKTELATEGQKVRGLIIALEDDPKLKYALKVIPDVDFYKYEVNFKLFKA